MPSYKSERGTWYCAFYYTDWHSKRKKKKKEGFKTKRAAQDWERKFLEQFSGTPDISFDMLVQAYLKDLKINVKASTYHIRVIIVGSRILPYFKEFPISAIDKRIVNEWKNSLIKSKFKPAYIRTVFRMLSTIFNYAVKYYNLPHNPCHGIGPLPQPEKRVDYWTISEFRQFAAGLKKPCHIMLYYLLFWTGMRVGEAMALKWDCIDLKAKEISIQKTLVRINKRDIISEPKTQSSKRVISLPQFIVDMLKDYKTMSKYGSSFLFPMKYTSLLSNFHTVSNRQGVKRIRIHDLRHSHASLLINAGFTPIEVADRLGHASANITLNTYSHFYSDNRSNVAARINRLI